MRPNQNLCELTSRILSHVRKVLQEVKPDMLIVQGDTTTTFTAALAVSLAHGFSLREAAHHASLVAAITVTRIGTQAAFPHRSEVN